MNRPTTSSIFHFFAHIMLRRSYLARDDKLSKFAFPKDLIAAKSKGRFPDFVLKTNKNDQFAGGEFIELKDTKSYSIASFNSTIPSAKKPFDTLTKKVQKILVNSGDLADTLPEREVYYLIRGINKSKSQLLSKTVLVSGAFFETMPVNEVLKTAFNEVVLSSIANEADGKALTEEMNVEQSKFAETRSVAKSAVSVRFRVMAEADSRANLLDSKKFPMISDNTLTLLVHETDIQGDNKLSSTHDWESAPMHVKQSRGYRQLDRAYDDIDKSLKMNTKVSILKHPLNGPFFLAQASIYS